MESEGEKNKISFSIDVGGGKKLRLIDMANEDDYLIASPLFDSLEDFRLSDSSNGDENYKCEGTRPSALQQSEPQLHLSSTSSIVPGRPSYMRKSLAWDSAFFTNDGVLNTDELFLLNEGLKPRSLHSNQEDTHLQRSEPALRKKVDASTQKKSSKHVFKEERVSRSLQSLEKSKNRTARSEEFKRTSSKPPKASCPLKDLLTGRSESRLLGKKNDIVSKEEKSVQTRAVPSVASRSLIPSNSQPRRVIAASPDISKNHLRRKTESTRGKLSASVSDITTRYKEKSKRKPTDLCHSTQSLSAISNHPSMKFASGSIVDRSLIENRKENPDSNFFAFLEGEISTPNPFSTASPETSASSQSGLRMPSPTIGYFTKEKPAVTTEFGSSPFQLQMCDKLPCKSAPRCRKTPAKVPISALDANTQNKKHGSVDKQAPPSYEKHKTGSNVVRNATNILTISVSAMEEKVSMSGNFRAGKHSRDKIDHSTTLMGEENQIKEMSLSMLDKQNKRHKSKTRINGARVPYTQNNGNESQDNKNSSSPQSGEQVNELSKLLGVIDLNEAKETKPKPRTYLYSGLTSENIHETYSEASPLPSAGSMLRTRSPLGNKHIRLL